MKEMTREKADGIFAQVKALVEKQDQQRKIFRKLVLTIEREVSKSAGHTVYTWERRMAEVLYSAGLGPKPLHVVFEERRLRYEQANRG